MREDDLDSSQDFSFKDFHQESASHYFPPRDVYHSRMGMLVMSDMLTVVSTRGVMVGEMIRWSGVQSGVDYGVS